MSEEDRERRNKRVESLGWLTESSIMPKKHKAIEGVGVSSILELKAQLYRSQEESRKSRDLAGPDVEYHRAKKIVAPNDTFSRKNSGVDSRAHKDKLELKAVKDGSASYAALEKKAELYDKLVRGELSDEEDEEKYCVDFFSKSMKMHDASQEQAQNASPTKPSAAKDAEDDDFSPYSGRHTGLGQTVGDVDNNQRKRFVWEVHEEATQAREKISELKSRRQEQALARREKLKQAYLQKQLEKLKAASKTEKPSDNA